MASSPYRRRPSAGLVRNLWVYRRLVLAAIILGVILWFILINRDPVSITLPFGLGRLSTTSGIAILLGAFVGSVATALVMTVVWTLKRYRAPEPAKPDDSNALPGERPPTDYAAKTGEGFDDAPWSRG